MEYDRCKELVLQVECRNNQKSLINLTFYLRNTLEKLNKFYVVYLSIASFDDDDLQSLLKASLSNVQIGLSIIVRNTLISL